MVSEPGPNGTVALEIEDGVAELRATAPERRNCVSFAFVEDLHEHVDTLAGRLDEVTAIALTHEGDVFCAGYDLDVIAGEGPDAERERLTEAYGPVREWLWHVDRPVVVGAKGPAVAAGAGHALVGDIVVAGPEFRIWWPEINVGLFPYTMGPEFVDRLGFRRAAEVTFLGREARLDPEEARELGLVNRIVATEAVDETVREMGATLAENERRYGYLLEAYELFNLAKRERRARGNAGTAVGSWRGTYDRWFGAEGPNLGGRDDPRRD